MIEPDVLVMLAELYLTEGLLVSHGSLFCHGVRT